MKYLEIDRIDQIPGNPLRAGEPFQFRCHSALSCFNACCRHLNLFLYPYDVIRLRQCLQIDSDQFINQYVDIVLRDGSHFPDVLLRMSDAADRRCPFVTPTGCRVYAHRPDTCRFFPLERARFYDAQTKRKTDIFFFRPPDFCQGAAEKRKMTPIKWIKDQKALAHARLTAQWAELVSLFQNDPWGIEGPQGPKAKMAFMATYNIDQFRAFVLQSSFLQRFQINPALQTKIQTNDLALLELAMAYIKYFLWQIPSPMLGHRQKK